MASTRVQESEPRRRMVMQLHLVRGSFSAGDAAAGCGGSSCDSGFAMMEAEVWSWLPDDILWRVLQFVPAAKQFQLHSVSRNWRQLLTSAEFRKAVTAMAATAAPAPIEARVVAYAAPDADARGSITSHGGGKSNVVDIDLTGLVPGWFWKSESYCVVAAADGLVCISNNSELEEEKSKRTREAWVPETTRYCVLNPLTRTCTVLPDLPFQPRIWLPPTADALTICRDWAVATYDLAARGGGDWARVWPAPLPVRVLFPITYPAEWEPPALAWCGGTFYWYLDGRVHVLAAGPGGPVAALDGLPVAQLGLDAASLVYFDEAVFLAAHRGALFLVATLSRPDTTVAWSVMCGVWRLALDHDVGVDVNRLEWEAVACLRLRDMERLTGLSVV